MSSSTRGGWIDPLEQLAASVAALLAGEITLDHARNIAVSVKKVPAAVRDVFEKELVDAARHVDPTTLGAFARELRSRLDPTETAEAAEQRKYDDRWLTVTPTFQGMHRLDGMLDPHSAAAVLTALNALTGKAGEVDDRTVGQRRADALVTTTTNGIHLCLYHWLVHHTNWRITKTRDNKIRIWRT